MHTITLWIIFNTVQISAGCLMFAWGEERTSKWGLLVFFAGVVGFISIAGNIEKNDCGSRIPVIFGSLF